MTTNEWITIIFIIMSFMCGYNMGKNHGMRTTMKTFLASVMVSETSKNNKED